MVLFLNECCLFSGAVTVSEERTLCTASERFVKMCESNEVSGVHVRVREDRGISVTRVCVPQLDLTFHLFVCALAGAGAAVIAMVRTRLSLQVLSEAQRRPPQV